MLRQFLTILMVLFWASPFCMGVEVRHYALTGVEDQKESLELRQLIVPSLTLENTDLQVVREYHYVISVKREGVEVFRKDFFEPIFHPLEETFYLGNSGNADLTLGVEENKALFKTKANVYGNYVVRSEESYILDKFVYGNVYNYNGRTRSSTPTLQKILNGHNYEDKIVEYTLQVLPQNDTPELNQEYYNGRTFELDNADKTIRSVVQDVDGDPVQLVIDQDRSYFTPEGSLAHLSLNSLPELINNDLWIPRQDQAGTMMLRFRFKDGTEGPTGSTEEISFQFHNIVNPADYPNLEGPAFLQVLEGTQDSSWLITESNGPLKTAITVFPKGIAEVTYESLGNDTGLFKYHLLPSGLNFHGEINAEVMVYKESDLVQYRSCLFTVEVFSDDDIPLWSGVPLGLQNVHASETLRFNFLQKENDHYQFIDEQDGDVVDILFVNSSNVMTVPNVGTAILNEGSLAMTISDNATGSFSLSLVALDKGQFARVSPVLEFNVNILPAIKTFEARPPKIVDLKWQEGLDYYYADHIFNLDLDPDVYPVKLRIPIAPQHGPIILDRYDVPDTDTSIGFSYVQTEGAPFGDFFVIEAIDRFGFTWVYSIQLELDGYVETKESLVLTHSLLGENSNVWSYQATGSANQQGTIYGYGLELTEHQRLWLEARDEIKLDGPLSETGHLTLKLSSFSLANASVTPKAPFILGLRELPSNREIRLLEWLSGGDGTGNFEIGLSDNIQLPTSSQTLNSYIATFSLAELNRSRRIFVRELGVGELVSPWAVFDLPFSPRNTAPVIFSTDYDISEGDSLVLDISRLITDAESAYDQLDIHIESPLSLRNEPLGMLFQINLDGSKSTISNNDLEHGHKKIIYEAPVSGTLNANTSCYISIIASDGEKITQGVIKINIKPFVATSSGTDGISLDFSSAVSTAQVYSGAVRGEFSVSPVGAALYNLPIEVPPGRGDMAPSLSLQYNSMMPENWLGVGWNLGGLSSISRTSKSVALDGHFETVHFNRTDIFSLDGERLLESTMTVPGALKTFHPENNPTVRVTLWEGDSAEEFDDYFLVEEKNGVQEFYGKSPAARTSYLGGQKEITLQWNLQENRDPYGNAIIYNYYKNSEGKSDIVSIRYTENDRKNVSTGQQIDFIYENLPAGKSLPENIYGYSFSGNTRLSKLVLRDGVALEFNGLPIESSANLYQSYSRVYSFIYKNRKSDDLSQSMVIDQIECALKDRWDGDEREAKLEPLRMDWSEGSLAGYTTTYLSIKDGVNNEGLLMTAATSLTPVDINGDGFDDLWAEGVVLSSTTDINALALHKAVIWENLKNGSFKLVEVGDTDFTNSTYGNPTFTPVIIKPLDFDGDGDLDIARFVYKNTGPVLEFYEAGRYGASGNRLCAIPWDYYERPGASSTYNLTADDVAKILNNSFHVVDEDHNGESELLYYPLRNCTFRSIKLDKAAILASGNNKILESGNAHLFGAVRTQKFDINGDGIEDLPSIVGNLLTVTSTGASFTPVSVDYGRDIFSNKFYEFQGNVLYAQMVHESIVFNNATTISDNNYIYKLHENNGNLSLEFISSSRGEYYIDGQFVDATKKAISLGHGQFNYVDDPEAIDGFQIGAQLQDSLSNDMFGTGSIFSARERSDNRVFAGDFNQNGIRDILTMRSEANESDQIHIALYENEVPIFRKTYFGVSLNNNATNYRDFSIADINEDGQVDILFYNEEGRYEVIYSQQNPHFNFGELVMLPSSLSNNHANEKIQMSVDIDGDGKPDTVTFESLTDQQILISVLDFKNNQVGLGRSQVLNIPSKNLSNWIMGDFFGIGRATMIGFNDLPTQLTTESVPVQPFVILPPVKGEAGYEHYRLDLVEKFSVGDKDKKGALITNIHYKAATAFVVQKKIDVAISDGTSYRLSPMTLVSTYEQGVGHAEPLVTSLKYFDMYFNRQGLGVLGFRAMQEEQSYPYGENLSQIATEKSYREFYVEPDLRGRVKHYEKQVDDFKVEEKNDYYIAKKSACYVDPDSSKVVYLFSSNINGYTKIEDTSFRYFTKTTTTTDVDDYLNVGTLTETQSNFYSQIISEQKFQMIVETEVFPNDLDNWAPGRLKKTRLTRNLGDSTTAITREVSFTYNDFGKLKLETREPNAETSSELDIKALFQQRHFDYDDFGNSKCELLWDINGSINNPSRTVISIFDEEDHYQYLKTLTENVTPIQSNGEWGTPQSHSKSYADYHRPTAKPRQVKDANGIMGISDYSPDGSLLSLVKEKYDSNKKNIERTKTAHYGQYRITGQAGEKLPFDVHGLATYFTYRKDPGSSYFIVQYDAIGREVRRVSVLPNGESDDGEIIAAPTQVHIDTVYDRRGNKVEVTEAYFRGARFIPSTRLIYDSLGRIFKRTVPSPQGGTEEIDGNTVPASVAESYEHRGFEVLMTNSFGRQSRKFFNHDQKPVLAIDALGTQVRSSYDSFLNLTKTEIQKVDGPWETLSEAQYDVLGRMLENKDASSGTWNYHYNAEGKLTHQTASNGSDISISYDELNREVKRIERHPDQLGIKTIIKVYDDLNRDGLLGSLTEELVFEAPEGDILDPDISRHQVIKRYNLWGKVASEYTKVANLDLHDSLEVLPSIESFTFTYEYDEYQRLWKTHYPQTSEETKPFVVVNHYNSMGILGSVTSDRGEKFWTLDSVNAREQKRQVSYGNGVQTEFSYLNGTGYLKEIHSVSGSNDLDHLSYSYDLNANMSSRKDLRQGVEEKFVYDDLERIDQVDLVDNSGSTLSSVNYSFDFRGNMKNNPYLGSYEYDNSPGRRLSKVYNTKNEIVYDMNYDDAGNMLSNGRINLFYNADQKPSKIVRYADGGSAYDLQKHFEYDGNRNIYRTEINYGSTQQVTVNVGSLFEVTTARNMQQKIRYFVPARGEIIAVREFSRYAIDHHRTFYYHYDHLHTLMAISDEKGEISEGRRYSYNLFGAQRKSDWTQNLEDDGSTSSGQFAGHQALSDIGLVHMGGRMYDPTLGRFVNADIAVGDGYDTQAYNRYSYGMNNPLSGIDPSGYYWEHQQYSPPKKNWVKIIVAVVIAVVAAIYTAGASSPLIAAAWAAGGAFLSTFVLTGDFKASLKAGLIAGVTAFAIGNINLSGLDEAGEIVSTAAVRGASSGLSGGDAKKSFFRSAAIGFLSWGAEFSIGDLGGKVDVIGEKDFAVSLNDIYTGIAGGLIEGTVYQLTSDDKNAFGYGFATGFMGAIAEATGPRQKKGTTTMERSDDAVELAAHVLASTLAAGYASEADGMLFTEGAINGFFSGLLKDSFGYPATNSSGTSPHDVKSSNNRPQEVNKKETIDNTTGEKDNAGKDVKNEVKLTTKESGGRPEKNNNLLATLGDPVNVVTGAFYVEEDPDFNIPGRSFTLSLSRFYSSRLEHDGLFGYGWTSEHEHRLFFPISARFPNQSSSNIIFYYDHRGSGYRVNVKQGEPENIWNYPEQGIAYETPKKAGFDFYFLPSSGEYLVMRRDHLALRFDADGKLLSKRDRTGQTLSYHYDANGRLLNVLEDSQPDRVLTFHYDGPHNKPTSVSDFTGRTVSFEYSENAGLWDLVKTTDVSGLTGKSYTYLSGQPIDDLNHNMSVLTNQEGTSLNVEYYPEDKVAYHQNSASGNFYFFYEPQLQLSVITDESKASTQVYYDDEGNVVRKVDALGNDERFVYDAKGQMVQHSDYRHQTTYTQYHLDRDDLVTEVKTPDGTRQTFEYHDQWNMPTLNQTVDVDGLVREEKRYFYTAQGQVDYVAQSLLEEGDFFIKNYRYDPATLQLVAEENLSPSFSAEVDADGGALDVLAETLYERESGSLWPTKTIQRTHDDGGVVFERFQENAYDTLGRVITSTDASGHVVHTTYNNLGQTLEQSDEFGASSFAYTPTGKIKYSTDASGNVTSYQYYPALDMVVGSLLKSKTTALGFTTTYQVDERGRVSQVTDPEGQRTRYVYDSLGRKVGEINELGLRALENSGVGINNFELCALDHFGVAEAYSKKYEYDEQGNLAAMVDESGHRVEQHYGAMNRLSSVEDMATGAMTKYYYDYKGRRSLTILPNGLSESTRFDALGRKTTVIRESDYGTSHPNTRDQGYYPQSDPPSVHVPRYRSTSFSYDALSRVTTQVNALGDVDVLQYSGNTTHSYRYVKLKSYHKDVLWPVGSEADPVGLGSNYRLISHSSSSVDVLGRTVYSVDGDGVEAFFSYDLRGRKIHEMVAGVETTSMYTVLDQLLSSTDANGAVSHFSYDADGRLLSADQGAMVEGVWLERQRGPLVYNARGQVLEEPNFEGLVSYSQYDALGRLEKSWVDRGKIVKTFVYNAISQVLEERLCTPFSPNLDDIATRYVYDSAGRLIEKIDNFHAINTGALYNIKTSNTYDIVGQITSTTNAEGEVSRYSRNVFGEVEEEVNPIGASRYFYYNSLGQRIAATNFDGSRVETLYDPNGQALVQESGLGLSGDRSQSTLVRTRNSLGGRVLSEVSSDGSHTLSTAYAYDTNGRLLSKTSVDAAQSNGLAQDLVESYSYTSAGQLETVSEQNELKLSHRYDGFGRKVSSSDVLGGVSEWTYDIMDRVLTQTSPEDDHGLRMVSRSEYDVLGRLVSQSETHGGVTRQSYTLYDDLNRVVKQSDYSGAVSSQDYNILGWPTLSTQNAEHLNSATKDVLTGEYLFSTAVVSSPQGPVTSHKEYDKLGRTVAVINGNGGRTSYAFQKSQLVSVTDASGRVTSYERDGMGQTLKEVRPNGEIVFNQYDRHQLLKRVVVQQAHQDHGQVAQAFNYDSLSRLVSAVDYNVLNGNSGTGHEVAYEYGLGGQLQAEWQDAHILRYQVDESGRRSQVQYPSLRGLTYQYDALDRLSGLTLLHKPDKNLLAHQRAKNGFRYASSVAEGVLNQTRSSYFYGVEATRSIKDDHYNDVLKESVSAWDENLRVKAFDTVQVPLAGTTAKTYSQNFDYDELGQVTEADLAGTSNGDYQHQWNYDPVGNWTASNHTGSAIVIGAVNGDNEYASFGNLAPIYNAIGQMVELNHASGNRQMFKYDWRGRLAKVEDQNGTVVRYEYDALDRRVKKLFPDGKTLRYVYDGAQVVEEYENGGLARVYYSQGVDQLVAQEKIVDVNHAELDETYYYVYDRLGSVRAMVTDGGQVIESYQYNAFGVLISQTESTAVDNHFLFTGREFDSETGLYYYRARYYSAEMGRFISRDPIGFGDGMNMYAYVGNNPLGFVDPSGTMAKDIGSFFREPSMLTFENIFRSAANDTPMIGEVFLGPGGLPYVSRAESELDHFSATSSTDINGHKINYDNPYFDPSHLLASTGDNWLSFDFWFGGNEGRIGRQINPMSGSKFDTAGGDTLRARGIMLDAAVESDQKLREAREFRKEVATQVVLEVVTLGTDKAITVTRYGVKAGAKGAEALVEIGSRVIKRGLGQISTLKRLEKAGKTLEVGIPQTIARLDSLAASTTNGISRISGPNANHINGAIGEAHGWQSALDNGHIGIKPPGKVTAPGVDFVTFDPIESRVVLWDSKYRGPNATSYPASVPNKKIGPWTKEAIESVNTMPASDLKVEILNSIDAGRVDAKIFRWPQ